MPWLEPLRFDRHDNDAQRRICQHSEEPPILVGAKGESTLTVAAHLIAVRGVAGDLKNERRTTHRLTVLCGN